MGFFETLFQIILAKLLPKEESGSAAPGPGTSGAANADKDETPPLKLLVMMLDGDLDDGVRQQLLPDLERVGTMRVARVERAVAVTNGGDRFADLVAAHRQADQARAAAACDAVVWGEYHASSNSMRLRITTAAGLKPERLFALGFAPPIPAIAGPVQALLIAAQAFSACVHGADNSLDRKERLDTLIDLMPDLRAQAFAHGHAVDGPTRSAAGAVFALAAMEIAEHRDRAFVADGLGLLRPVVGEADAVTTPLYAAGLNYLLGDLALRNLSSMAGFGDHATAQAAYSAALDLLGPMGSAGMARGMCHFGLGKALMMQGRETDSVEKVNTAMAEYRRAIAVLPVRNYPYQWAVVMSELGRALVKQGELDGVHGPFEQAVLAFQGAQRVMPRNERIAEWALNAYSLGSALFVLGKRKNNADMIRQALAAFAQSAEAYEEADAHRSARSANGNVYRCEQLLNEMNAASAAE